MLVYGEGRVYPEYFANTRAYRRTIRIDSKLLADAERADSNKGNRYAAEELRQIIATVGKPGQPGEHVRCVVSVAMLNEGWDANNVTQILGIRAFGSQLLCEQVVGRGLRRMDYIPDPVTGLLTEEYVDVYGIPFTSFPSKDALRRRRSLTTNRRTMSVHCLSGLRWEIRSSRRRRLRVCPAQKRHSLRYRQHGAAGFSNPNREPTATFVAPTVGYQVGAPVAIRWALCLHRAEP